MFLIQLAAEIFTSELDPADKDTLHSCLKVRLDQGLQDKVS